MENQFSSPSDWQKNLMLKMASIDLYHSRELRHQLETAMVKIIDENGTFLIKTEGDRWPGSRRIPVEAEYKDTDGITVHILMHVISGYIKEFEIYKADGSPAPLNFPLENLLVMEGRQGKW